MSYASNSKGRTRDGNIEITIMYIRWILQTHNHCFIVMTKHGHHNCTITISQLIIHKTFSIENEKQQN